MKSSGPEYIPWTRRPSTGRRSQTSSQVRAASSSRRSATAPTSRSGMRRTMLLAIRRCSARLGGGLAGEALRRLWVVTCDPVIGRERVESRLDRAAEVPPSERAARMEAAALDLAARRQLLADDHLHTLALERRIRRGDRGEERVRARMPRA